MVGTRSRVVRALLAGSLASLAAISPVAMRDAGADNVYLNSPNWSGYQAPQDNFGGNYIQLNGANQCMTANGASTIYDPSGLFRVVMQTDGNLVEYDTSNDAIWATNEARSGTGNYAFCVQTDGDNVIYSPSGVALWASHTGGGYTGWCNCYMVMQSDGNLVDYKYNGGPAVWAHNGAANIPLRYHTVDGFFVLQQPNGGGGSEFAPWVGMSGGAQGGSIVQTGLDGEIYLDGTTHYTYWWENYPNPPTSYAAPSVVSGGDVIYAYVRNISASQTNYYIVDETQNLQLLSVTEPTPYKAADALDFIAEVRQGWNLGCRSTTTGLVSDNVWFDWNSNSEYLNQSSKTAFDMHPPGGGSVLPSSVDSNGSFSYTCN